MAVINIGKTRNKAISTFSVSVFMATSFSLLVNTRDLFPSTGLLPCQHYKSSCAFILKHGGIPLSKILVVFSYSIRDTYP